MDDEEIIHRTNNIDENIHGRPLIGFIRKVCDAREDVILLHETRNRFGTTDTSHNTILQIKVTRQCDVVGISSYSICFTLWCIKYDNSNYPYRPFIDYIRNIPYLSPSMLEYIQTIQLQNSDVGKLSHLYEYRPRHIIWNEPSHIIQSIKTQIEDNLNKDVTYHQLKQLDILKELEELKLEIKELHIKTSMLQKILKDQEEKIKNEIYELKQTMKCLLG